VTCGHPTVKIGILLEEDSRPQRKRETWADNLLESAPSWRRGVGPKEDHAWRVFHLGGLINPSLTLVHPCIVERYL
jgi:hypothetical protein